MKPRRSHRPWTNKETQVIIDNPHQSDKELSKILSRSPIAIQHIKRRLGVSHNKKDWSDDEISILRDNVKKSAKDIKKLLPNRTERAIGRKRKELGISRLNPWTSEELQILKDNCEKSLEELNILLPKRSVSTISQKRKKLGLEQEPNWSDEEIEILVEGHKKGLNYLSTVLNRSNKAIRRKMVNLGLLEGVKTGKENALWKGYGDISGAHWSKIERSAIKRNLEFTITIEYVWELFLEQDRRCAFTGRKIGFSKTKNLVTTETTASLDRIDSSKGYIEGNVQWIRKELQNTKWKLNEDEFFQICLEVAMNKFPHLFVEDSVKQHNLEIG